MIRPRVSRRYKLRVCVRIRSMDRSRGGGEDGGGGGGGEWRGGVAVALWTLKGCTARARGTGLGACVSDVLMTLRNTEQANQYGRHCVHSGARHVLPRVIASGNVSAASECRNECPRATRFTVFPTARDLIPSFLRTFHSLLVLQDLSSFLFHSLSFSFTFTYSHSLARQEGTLKRRRPIAENVFFRAAVTAK